MEVDAFEPPVHPPPEPELYRRDKARAEAVERRLTMYILKMRQEGCPEPTIVPLYLSEGDWRALANQMIVVRGALSTTKMAQWDAGAC